MRIGKFVRYPRRHCLCDLRSDRRGCLIVEVDHAALDEARSRMRCHSAMKRSTSSLLVSGPKLIRTNEDAISAATSIAAITGLAFILPDEQALPAETAMPARSNCTSWLDAANPGIA